MNKILILLVCICFYSNNYAQVLVPSDTLLNWHRIASKNARMENFDEAVKYCDMLLQAEPKNCKYIGLKASILKTMKQYNQADTLLLQGLEFACDSVKFYLMLTNSKSSQKNYVKALEYISMAIKLKPDSADLYIDRSYLHTMLGNIENDKKDLQKAKMLGSKRAAELLEILEHPEK